MYIYIYIYTYICVYIYIYIHIYNALHKTHFATTKLHNWRGAAGRGGGIYSCNRHNHYS